VAIRRAYAEVEGAQLHYRYAGDRDKPVLVLLHQSPSHSAMYDELMRRLCNSFFVLAPDTPGFGQSDSLPLQDPAIEDFARSIHGLLQQLEISRCMLFGHHTGAAIAVAIEYLYPGTCERMALSGPTVLTEEQRTALPASAAMPEATEDGSYLLTLWQRLRDKDKDVSLDISQRELLSALSAGEAYPASYAAVCRHDVETQMASVACPVLVYAGTHDPLYGAVDPSVALLPQGQKATLDGGEKTYVCERQADRVAALLTEFFTEAVADQVGEC
jgi:haloalkane dehalogenase